MTHNSLYHLGHPLQKQHSLTNFERLNWLKAKFNKLPKHRQKELFKYLKQDLQDFITKNIR